MSRIPPMSYAEALRIVARDDERVKKLDRLLGGLLFGKSLLGYVFDSAFHLTDEGWRKLTFRWGVFFFVLAVLNELVWRNFSTDAWVNFKVFGIMPLTFLFMMTQVPLLNRTQIREEEAKGS